MPFVLHAQQRQRRGQCAAAAASVALAVATLGLLLSPAAAVKAVSPWTPGLITHYGGAQVGEAVQGRAAEGLG